MIDLEKLIFYYRNVEVIRLIWIRDLPRLNFALYDLAKSKWNEHFQSNFPFKKLSRDQSFTGDSKNWSSFRKNELKQLHKQINGKYLINDIPEIAESIYLETFFSFEKSIFWFFNYKYNMNRFHGIAGEQALYYAKFFAVNAILRFIGCAIKFTKYGNFRIKTDWGDETISIKVKSGMTSSHKYIFQLFLEQLRKFDISNYDSLNILVNELKFQKNIKRFTKEREHIVYDLTSRESDPFRYYNSVSNYDCYKQYCFLFPDDKLNEAAFNSLGSGNYQNPKEFHFSQWGYEEMNIGQYWQLLIDNFKKSTNTVEYLKLLKKKIEYFKELDRSTRDLLLKWLI